MARPIVYGEDAIAVKCASNGPDGGSAFGGGPPKLIYLDRRNFRISRYMPRTSGIYTALKNLYHIDNIK